MKNIKNIINLIIFFFFSFVCSLDLIRVNRNGQMGSNNIADYNIFVCSKEGEDRTCKVDQNNIMEYAEVS